MGFHFSCESLDPECEGDLGRPPANHIVLKSYVPIMVPNGTYQVSLLYHSCCHYVVHGHVCIRHLAHARTQSIGTGLFGPCPRCPRPKEMSCRVCHVASFWHFVLFCQLNPNPQHLCWDSKRSQSWCMCNWKFGAVGPAFLSKTALQFTVLCFWQLAFLQLFSCIQTHGRWKQLQKNSADVCDRNDNKNSWDGDFFGN